MSLIEVMIAMTIFSVLAVTILSSVLLSRRIAEANIYGNTALTITQGYLEQIKSMEYNVVLDSVGDNSIPLPTKSISAITSTTGAGIEIDDPIYINSQKEHASNSKKVVIDIRNPESANPSPVTMSYLIRPTVVDLDTGANPLRALEITLEYQFLSPEKGSPELRDGTVRLVKSFVPTF